MIGGGGAAAHSSSLNYSYADLGFDVAVGICGLSRPRQRSAVITYVCAAVVCELTQSFRGVDPTVTAFVNIRAAEIKEEKVKANAYVFHARHTHTLTTVVTCCFHGN